MLDVHTYTLYTDNDGERLYFVFVWGCCCNIHKIIVKSRHKQEKRLFIFVVLDVNVFVNGNIKGSLSLSLYVLTQCECHAYTCVIWVYLRHEYDIS